MSQTLIKTKTGSNYIIDHENGTIKGGKLPEPIKITDKESIMQVGQPLNIGILYKNEPKRIITSSIESIGLGYQEKTGEIDREVLIASFSNAGIHLKNVPTREDNEQEFF